MDFDRRRVAFRVVVAVAIAALLVTGVGWDRVLRNLRDANLAVYAFAPLGAALALLAGGEGTRVALGFPVWSVRGALARRAFYGAAIVRNFLPAGNVGGGGFVAYTVSRHGDVTVSEAIAGVAGWEFVMMVASAVVGGVGVLGVVAAGQDPAGTVGLFVAFGAVLAAIATAGVVLEAYREAVAAVVTRLALAFEPVLARVVPGHDVRLDAGRVRRGLDEFFATLSRLAADRSRFVTVLAAAHAAWLCWMIPLFVSLLAVGVVVSPAVVMVAVTVSGFARAVPLPAGIGPVDVALGGVLVALTPHSLGELASALVLYRSSMVLVQVMAGGLSLWTLDVAATGKLAD
ncbi:lysylphosphatidylglycerol synthase domain-containing protein [Halobacterium noricense]|uniref:lysylphosphatidylglycerol synthase domain-containing protein n=1 Tax=Halobacterium noricense TaxID=223182 RepID=UPI001E53EACF|nr:lysylphosphatidylglycerol synthase domain-containing protein [Halobacterium noricense]UHH25886.1 lysylphosphatidylglycerol synthase domain-containing protein [Halobacterium noricense]